jgi:hypothetical protein
MANRIIQSALVIGGTVKNSGLVTIDASDAAGNPLAGVALAAATSVPNSQIVESRSGAQRLQYVKTVRFCNNDKASFRPLRAPGLYTGRGFQSQDFFRIQTCPNSRIPAALCPTSSL